MLFDRALARPTARITAAYVATHQVGAGVLPELIASIAASISKASASDADPIIAESAPRLTAAQIRKSITPKALISFEDGKAYRTLK